MDAKEKRKQEQKNRTEKRKEEIIDAAIAEFREKGIEHTTIAEVAKRAEVGTVTVYRYFFTKPQLVIEAAMKMWRIEISGLLPMVNTQCSQASSGIQQVRSIFQTFVILFEEHADFLRLLEEFDSYIMKEKVQPQDLSDYEKCIIDLREVLFCALEKGKKDGSIRKEIDNYSYYMCSTHALISLSQKLIMRGNILKSDRDIGSDTQIKLLIDMVVSYVRT